MYSKEITIKSKEKLRQEFSEIQASIYTNEALFSMGFDGGFDACYKLMQEREKALVEALEFYADSNYWGHVSPEEATYSTIDKIDLGKGDFMLNEMVDDERVGGRRAREALSKIRCEK